MTDLTPVSEKTFLQWALGRILNQIYPDPTLAKSKLELLLANTSSINSKTDRHLLEVLQELVSEQELR